MASVFAGAAVLLMRGARIRPETHYVLASAYLGLPLFLILAAGLLLWSAVKVLPPQPEAKKAPKWTWPEGLGLAALILAGAWFRLTRINELPTGCFFDEAQNGLEAMRILDSLKAGAWKDLPVYIERLSQNAALYMYEAALSIKILGATKLAVRAVSLASGILTLPLFYLLARCLFGVGPALGGAAFLAVMRWHFNFSRVGFLGVQTVLFEIPALLFLWKATEKRRPRDFILAGAFLGLGFHSYIASRALPLVFAAWLLYLLIFHRPARLGKFLKASATFRDGLLLAGSALLVFAPLLPALFQGIYFSRNKSAGIWAHVPGFENAEGLSKLAIVLTKPFWSNVAKHLLMFLYLGDGNGRHNVPGWPLLEPVLGTLFLLGLMLALIRPRDKRGVLALILGGVMLQGGIWSIPWEAPQGYRSLGAIPAVALLVSLAVEHWGRVLQPLKAKALGPALLIGALLISGFNAYREYFILGPMDQGVWAGYDTVEAHIGEVLKAMKQGQGKPVPGSPAPFTAYFSPRYAGHPTIRFLSGGWEDYPSLDLGGDLPFHLVPAKPLLLFLDPIVKDQLGRIRKLYPNAAVEPLVSPANQEEVLYSIRIQPEDVRDSFGLKGEGGLMKGSLWVPPEGRVHLNSRGRGALRLDGRQILSGAGALDLKLPSGLHSLELDGGSENSVSASPGLVVKATGFGGLRRWFQRTVPTADGSGKPEGERYDEGIDPVLSLSAEFSPMRGLMGPVKATWEGKLVPLVPGHYHLGLKASGNARLDLGRLGVVEAKPHESQEKEFDLTGPIPLRVEVDYQGGNGHFLELFWQKPDGSRGPVPEENLKP